MEIQRFKALDGIRGIAALIVAFIWHYQHFAPETYPFSKILYWSYHFGWIMVDLFFILSGFIFLSIYSDKINNHSISAKDFFVLRFSRLYPLHWLMLLVVIIVKILRKMSIGTGFFVYHNNNLFSFLQNLLLIQNGWLQTDFSFNGPAWSIPVEILMYIIFFAVFYYAKNKKTYIVLCLALIYYGLMMYSSGWNNSLFNGQIARGLMGFFIGCITAEVYKYCIINRKKSNWFIGFCGVAVVFLTVIPVIFGYGVLRNWVLVYTFAFFPALLLIVLRIGVLSKIFSIKPLVYLGELSYSIYLLHYPMQLIVKTIDDHFNSSINYSGRLFFIIFSAGVIVLSHFIHYGFEKPIQNYIRKKFV